MFYLGYLCMQPFNNVIMQKVQISKYIGVILLIWGGCLACMAAAKNFSQLAALRFLLGFFEAVTYPCIFLLISTFYRRTEQVFWFGVMFMSNGIAQILGGLIGFGIGQMPVYNGITPWKWIMIIFGAFTALLGLIYFFFLPDTPYSRWFRLTEDEKEIVELRVRDNAVVPTLKFNWDHIREALRESRFYCYCAISFLNNLQNGGFTLFGSLIIKDMGFSSLNAILLNMPVGAVSIICISFCTWLSRRYNQIIWPAIFAETLAIIAMIILISVPSGGVRLVGYYLNVSLTSCYVLLQGSISANTSGYTKKIFYTSGNMVAYTLGNFIGSLVLVQKEAPRYFGGLSCYLASNVLIIILLLYVRWNLTKLNRQRNADLSKAQESLVDGLEDLTDVQNKNFVYKV